MAKVQVTERDMETVGLINGQHVFHNGCYALSVAAVLAHKNGQRPTPIFRKTAKEYGLTCSVCGRALAE